MDKDRRSNLTGGVLCLIAVIGAILAAMMVTSCRSNVGMISTNETQTETVYRYIETIDTVTVEVEVQAQTASNKTNARESHLETDYAESDAWIDEDGNLNHTLANKERSIPVDVPVVNSKTEKEAEHVTTITVPVEVERELSLWEILRLKTWLWLAGALAATVIWIFRTPLITLARRLI